MGLGSAAAAAAVGEGRGGGGAVAAAAVAAAVVVAITSVVVAAAAVVVIVIVVCVLYEHENTIMVTRSTKKTKKNGVPLYRCYCCTAVHVHKRNITHAIPHTTAVHEKKNGTHFLGASYY